jgi:hypothetical protein
MRIGTTAVVVGLAIALAGCGGAQAKPHGADTIVSNDSAIVPVAAAAAAIATPSPTDSPDADADADASSVHPPVAPPSCPGGTPTVHFDTPEAAMTYLASAWNRNDLDELCQVTNPNARFLLNDMHREAFNLRLISCKNTGVGMYQCIFKHDYPKKMHKKGTGRASFDVGAADNPGYYMTVFEGCG